MLRRHLLATIGLLASASVLSAQTPPGQPSAPASTELASQQETMEDPQIGDHWTYEVRDDVSGDLKSTITHTITDITPAEISIRLAVLGRAQRRLLHLRPRVGLDKHRHLAFDAKRRHGHSCAARGREDVVFQVHRFQHIFRCQPEDLRHFEGDRQGNLDHPRRHLRDVQDRDDLRVAQLQRSRPRSIYPSSRPGTRPRSIIG